MKHPCPRVALLAVAVVMTTPPLTEAWAAPSSKKVVLTGTVTAISEVDAKPRSRRNWAVTVQVESVKSGRYSQPVFTFAVHSPARVGLAVGRRYTIEAVWTGVEYVVDETRPMKAEMLTISMKRLPNPPLQTGSSLTLGTTPLNGMVVRQHTRDTERGHRHAEGATAI